jgi:hypothetical protein
MKVCIRCLLALCVPGLFVTLGLAAPEGNEDRPWDYPIGTFADRDTYPEQEPNDPCGNDQAVNCGDVVDPGCIDELGDHDWYVFDATADSTITCGTAESAGQPTVDTYIELYSSDCATRLAFDDDGGPGLYSLISEFVAPYTGTYHLLVRSYGDYYTGCYMVFFECTPPPPTGACCFVDGSCVVTYATECAGAGGEYQGDDTGCDPNPCELGACCSANEMCVEQTRAECEAQAGEFLPGDVCDPNPCEIGACCLPGEVCIVQTRVDCEAQAGVFLSGYACDPNPCELGACCFPGEICVEQTRADCMAHAGDFLPGDV